MKKLTVAEYYRKHGRLPERFKMTEPHTQTHAEENISHTIAQETMLANLRDCLLDIYKHGQPKPWQEMTEEEQRELADRIQNSCRYAIVQAVSIIAAGGFETVSGELEKVTIKDTYQCVINISKHTEARHAIADATGSVIKMIVANTDQYMGGDAPVIDPDQPELHVADMAENIPQAAE